MRRNCPFRCFVLIGLVIDICHAQSNPPNSAADVKQNQTMSGQLLELSSSQADLDAIDSSGNHVYVVFQITHSTQNDNAQVHDTVKIIYVTQKNIKVAVRIVPFVKRVEAMSGKLLALSSSQADLDTIDSSGHNVSEVFLITDSTQNDNAHVHDTVNIIYATRNDAKVAIRIVPVKQVKNQNPSEVGGQAGLSPPAQPPQEPEDRPYYPSGGSPSSGGSYRGRDEETIRNASTVLQAMVSSREIPASVLAKADCIIVLPSVKKFAVGIGGTGGRGPMTCRTGHHFSGKWSPSAMYSIGGASAGFQIGGTATDYVLVIMSASAVDKVLNGKVKVGSDVSAAAGPGASAGNTIGGADILTYSRKSGLFAGVSLDGATLTLDSDANQRLYGKAVSATDIVREGGVTATPADASFVSVLNSKVPQHQE
jgi:SH3 domain-containing YSC84-like protein 1